MSYLRHVNQPGFVPAVTSKRDLVPSCSLYEQCVCINIEPDVELAHNLICRSFSSFATLIKSTCHYIL